MCILIINNIIENRRSRENSNSIEGQQIKKLLKTYRSRRKISRREMRINRKPHEVGCEDGA